MPSDFGPGPKLDGAAGIGPGRGTPDGNGLGGFGPRTRKGFVPDRTPPSERAVNAALVWLANHQDYDGHWSLQHYTHECKDKTCTGEGELSADAGATAMGLLPFLAAGQTHKAKCPYKEHVHKAIQWLIAPSAVRRQPGQGRGADDVFARPGHDRPLRGLRADRRQAGRHGGAGGGELHSQRPEHGRRRLARTIPRTPAIRRWSVGN